MINSIDNDGNRIRYLGWFTYLSYAAVFAAGFWAIDHTPFASSYFEQDSIVAESENRTADRIETVNTITAPVRICLGLFGMAFLLFPTRTKLNWGGFLFVLLVGYVLYLGATALWSVNPCLLYTSPSPRDQRGSRMPSSA